VSAPKTLERQTGMTDGLCKAQIELYGTFTHG
jgi:hypothetical protein